MKRLSPFLLTQLPVLGAVCASKREPFSKVIRTIWLVFLSIKNPPGLGAVT